MTTIDLDNLDGEDLAEELETAERRVSILKALLKASGKSTRRRKSLESPANGESALSDDELRSRIRTYLVAAGPSSLSAIASGVKTHHMSVHHAMSRSAEFKKDPKTGVWSLK